MKTIFESFRYQRDTRPGEPAFLIAAGDRSVAITWAEFAADIEATAWLVRKYAPGGTIALLGENSYEWISAHAACIFAGAVVVPLDVSLSAAEIAELLKFVGASALVHSSLFAGKAHEVGRLLPGLVIRAFGSKLSEGFINQGHKAIAAGEKGIFDLSPPDDTSVSMIMFTSGTTSRPRGAELTMAGMAVFREYWASQLKVRTGDRSLMVLPLHHIFGLCAAYMMLSEGAVLGVCPNFRRLYDAVERFRAERLFLVPALADILAAKIEQHGTSAEAALGTRLEWIVTGGAPLPRRTYERLSALGVHVMSAYGLTETTALYSVATFGDEPRVGSAGRACNALGVETALSAEGELLIRGPAVFKGYYRDRERTAAVLDADGWFHTGDIGSIDNDGYVWISGRASRMIVLSSGKKVSPEELEDKILSLPGIREVAVSGDGETREITAEVYAVISEESVNREIEALNRNLPIYKRISMIKYRTEPFARTTSGKIRVLQSSTRRAAVVERSRIDDGRTIVDSGAKPSRKAVFKGILLVAVLVAAVAFVGLISKLFAAVGIEITPVFRRVLGIVDVLGEILLAGAVLYLILKAGGRKR